MTKTSQFFFRINPKDLRVIQRAAKIDRRTTSDFIRLAALDRADDVIGVERKKKRSKKGL